MLACLCSYSNTLLQMSLHVHSFFFQGERGDLRVNILRKIACHLQEVLHTAGERKPCQVCDLPFPQPICYGITRSSLPIPPFSNPGAALLADLDLKMHLNYREASNMNLELRNCLE